MKNILKKLLKAPVVYILGPLFVLAIVSGVFYLIVFPQTPRVQNIEFQARGILISLEDEDFAEMRDVYISGTSTRYLFRPGGWPRGSRLFNGTLEIDGFSFTTTGGNSFFVGSNLGNSVMPWMPENITDNPPAPSHMGTIFSEPGFRRFIVIIRNISDSQSPDYNAAPANLMFVYPAGNRDEALDILYGFREALR